MKSNLKALTMKRKTNKMAKLSYGQRKRLPAKEFIFPKERKFPIPDAAHARNALSRAGAKSSTVDEAVKREVKRRFPSIKVAGK